MFATEVCASWEVGHRLGSSWTSEEGMKETNEWGHGRVETVRRRKGKVLNRLTVSTHVAYFTVQHMVVTLIPA